MKHLMVRVVSVVVLMAGFGDIVMADNLLIQFTGLNLTFDQETIYDSTNILGGGGDLLKATQLGTVEFFLDDGLGNLTSQGVVTDGFADVYIPGVPGIPVGGFVQSLAGGAGFGVDLLSTSLGKILGLPIDGLDVFYSGDQSYVGINGLAAGTVTQDLPFGLSIRPGDEVTLLLTCDSLENTAFDGNNQLIRFEATGTGEIGANAVPEPSTWAGLLGLAAAALVMGIGRLGRRRPTASDPPI